MPCHVFFSLCRRTQENRESRCVAIGLALLGTTVLLMALTEVSQRIIHQRDALVMKAQAVSE